MLNKNKYPSELCLKTLTILPAVCNNIYKG